jgi:hypothetical protein
MFTLTLQLGFWTQVLPLIVHHWDSQLLWLRVPHVLQAGLETCMASDLELAGACMLAPAEVFILWAAPQLLACAAVQAF